MGERCREDGRRLGERQRLIDWLKARAKADELLAKAKKKSSRDVGVSESPPFFEQAELGDAAPAKEKRQCVARRGSRQEG